MIVTIALAVTFIVTVYNSPTGVYNHDNLQSLYSDQSDSPLNNPPLYANSSQDLQPPLTQIVSVLNSSNLPAPSIVKDNYVTVHFNASDNTQVGRFECAIDGTAFVKCMSPVVVYNTAKNITKTIEIRAVDIHNNVEQQPAVFMYRTQ